MNPNQNHHHITHAFQKSFRFDPKDLIEYHGDRSEMCAVGSVKRARVCMFRCVCLCVCVWSLIPYPNQGHLLPKQQCRRLQQRSHKRSHSSVTMGGACLLFVCSGAT